jgi:stress-induced morphogen
MDRATSIRERLQERLAPTHLEVHDESHAHAVKPGAQSHFRVVVVSSAFEGLGALARHKSVYAAVGDSLGHALAITARTPAEWSARPEALASPACAHARS